MIRQPPLGPDDARQPDRLDAYLDGLAHGQTVPSHNLDPTLAATVRHVHGLASESVANDLDRAGKAQRWEHLMQHQNRSVHAKVTPFPTTATLPSSFVPAPISLRPVAQQSRLRRLGGQSLGLVATLTLVLLIAASGLAVYLTAPQGGDEPTMMPAAFGASPEATPASTPTGPGDPTLDLARVAAIECTVEPREFDEVMQILSAPTDGRAFDQAYGESFDTNPLVRIGLTDGTPVTQDLREELTIRYGEYLGCYLPLQQARFFSDAGLLRFFRTQESPLMTAQLYELLWLDEQGDMTPPSYDSDYLNVGNPGSSYLYGFRWIGSERIAAFISLSASQLQDTGFIVFVEVNGQWLVDEIRPVPYG